MTPLAAHLKRLIAADGPIPVSRFMAEALGHPEFGYYVSRDPLGRRGDFITAPEISQMFGELIGLWCAEFWQQMGAPPSCRLVELGPGRGTLMADALRAAAAVRPAFIAAIDVHLVETSPVLRQAQRVALERHGPTWHAAVDDVPDGPAIVIANEFFDAMPIRQYQRLAERWHERMVTVAGDGLAFALSPDPLPAAALPAPFAAAGEGEVAEVSPSADALMRTLGHRLAAQGGAALIIDYGPAQSGPGDTLQAVRGHAFAPVLEAPGDADLTAHVDFGALGRSARAAGADVYGPIAQGEFLRRLGIELRAERLKDGAAPAQAQGVDAALERLTGDEQMGRLFKVLAATSPGLMPPGFQEDERPCRTR